MKLPVFRLSNVLCWKFAKFLTLFLKEQVTFPSNVASIFSSIKHNSPIISLTHAWYTFFKRSTFKCNFLRGPKFVKFLMLILNWRVNISWFYLGLNHHSLPRLFNGFFLTNDRLMMTKDRLFLTKKS